MRTATKKARFGEDRDNGTDHTYETVLTIKPSGMLRTDITTDGDVVLFVKTVPMNGAPVKELAEQATSDEVTQEALFLKMMQMLNQANTMDVLRQHIQ